MEMPYIVPIQNQSFNVNYTLTSNPKFHFDLFAIPMDGTFGTDEKRHKLSLPLLPIY